MTKVQILKVNTPLAVRNGALEYANAEEPKTVSDGRRGPTLGGLTKAVQACLGLSKENFIGSDQKITSEQKDEIENNTRLVLGWLFCDEQESLSPISRGDLTAQQINGLGHWMYGASFNEPHYKKWVARRMFSEELCWLLFWVRNGWKWTIDDLSIGENLFFSEILERYQNETVFGDTQPGYFNLGSISGVEEKVANGEWGRKQEPGLPDGAVWCEWCGEVMTAPDVPCDQCKKLGAYPENKAQSRRPLAPGEAEQENSIPDMATFGSGAHSGEAVNTTAFDGLP